MMSEAFQGQVPLFFTNGVFKSYPSRSEGLSMQTLVAVET